jgi:hypothetical protein
MSRWKTVLGRSTPEKEKPDKDNEQASSTDLEESVARIPKWSLGVLNDKATDEVPGESQLKEIETQHPETQ